MTAIPPDLTALIGSRICHDLISPLGAIGNGVELMSMAGNAEGPEMSLIAESVENANARIRFFRVAFGAAHPGQVISPSEVTGTLRDLTKGGRFLVDWEPAGTLQRQQVKLAFLLLQCFESAMPRGGHVSVRQVGEEWALTGEAEVLAVKPDLWAMLSAPKAKPELEASEVHFALAPLAAEAIGRRVVVETSDRVARVRF
ncbi:MAG: histidine phosphotransferase family protein [Paracoccaceae bacterium]